MKGHRDLRIVTAATAVCAVGSLLVPLGPVRVVFAVPLALFLPGYSLTAVVSGSRRLGRLGLIELLPLSVGLSLAILALGSILLNYTPGGIQGLPWALLLAAISVGCCRGAAVRRPAAPSRQPAIAMPRISLPGAAMLAGGVIAAVAALVLAQTTLDASRAFGYTELWMTPVAPGHGGRSSARVAHIGVTSEQQHPTTYRLEVRIGGLPPTVVRSFTLDPGESRLVRLDAGGSDRATPVEAILLKRGSPETVYRKVFGWLPPGEAPR